MNGQPSVPIKKWKIILAAAIAVLLLSALAVLCIPFFRFLSQPDTQLQLEEWIASLGLGGWLLFLLLQMLQIIIAFIPGEPFQVAAGVLYGPIGGVLTCLLGSFLASALIFYAVRRLGEKVVIRLFGRNKLEEFSFFKNTQRVETVVLVLFLLPGIPKDLLTYLAGLSPITPAKFLAISTLARIPALTASTLLGASVSRGNLLLTGIIAAAALLAGLAGVIYRKRIMAFLHSHGSHKNSGHL